MKKATYLFFLLVLILPNLVLAFTESLSWVGRLVGVVAPLAAYWLVLTLSRKVGRTVILLFPLLFLGAFQMVLTYLYGRGPIAVDMWLNLVTTNSGEVGELLSQLLPAIVWVVVIYIPTLTLAAVLWRRRRWADATFLHRQRRPAFVATAAMAMVTASLALFTPYAPTADLFPLNAVWNFVLALGRQKASANYKQASSAFRYDAHCTFADREPETVVLVIGETSRADNWQLYGYRRPTNPQLSKAKGLTVFTNYMSQSNTTHKSVPILLSLAEADNYDILYRTKGIMQAFREAGYNTVFLSNQQRNHSFIDYLGEQATPTPSTTPPCWRRSASAWQPTVASACLWWSTPTAPISATLTVTRRLPAPLRPTITKGRNAPTARSSSTPTTTPFATPTSCSAR